MNRLPPPPPEMQSAIKITDDMVARIWNRVQALSLLRRVISLKSLGMEGWAMAVRLHHGMVIELHLWPPGIDLPEGDFPPISVHQELNCGIRLVIDTNEPGTQRIAWRKDVPRKLEYEAVCAIMHIACVRGAGGITKKEAGKPTIHFHQTTWENPPR